MFEWYIVPPYIFLFHIYKTMTPEEEVVVTPAVEEEAVEEVAEEVAVEEAVAEEEVAAEEVAE